MKKVLIITYYWPPSGGSGVQRWMYFAKYLSDFGIEPLVLTVSEKYASYRQVDEKLNNEVRNIKVFKTASFEPLKIYSLLTSGNRKKGIPQGEIKSENANFIVSVSKFIRGSLFIPDARKLWNVFAFRKAKEIIKNEKIDLVITTGPPHSTHLTGKRLKKRFGLKWIADFRDPWSDLYYNKDLIRTRRAVSKDKRLEKKVLDEADLILTVGFKMKELLAGKSENINDKIKFIYNGYDSELFNKIKFERTDFFEISYIGLLTQNSPYKFFIQSIKGFLKKTIPGSKIRLNFAGNIPDTILESFKKELPDLKILYHGYVSHEEAIRIMKSSNLLISCLPETEQSQILISGKTAEYMASGIPILSFGNVNGESAWMLNQLKHTKTVAKNEVSEATEFIHKIYDSSVKGELLLNDTDSELIKKMNRYETARQLADLINKF
ncbi:MAG: glycosyltransferase family 4 protein [Bacteroidales bacterium]|nr:glycosyltransferase family 4 protein [Bacteroidales bacterium]